MTNNDNLEKFIRKNRYKFNREHPFDNHMDKFLSKLPFIKWIKKISQSNDFVNV